MTIEARVTVPYCENACCISAWVVWNDRFPKYRFLLITHPFAGSSAHAKQKQKQKRPRRKRSRQTGGTEPGPASRQSTAAGRQCPKWVLSISGGCEAKEA